MKSDRRQQLKQLQQQKADGAPLTGRQQTRLDFLQRRAQDSKPAQRPQQPQPMPGYQPIGQMQPAPGAPMRDGMVNYPGQLQPALDAAPGMPMRDMAERVGSQELRPDNMAMDPSQNPFPMPRGGMQQPAAWQPQAMGQQTPDGIANPISRPGAAPAPVYGITNPVSRPGASNPRPVYGITNPIGRPRGLMALGQKAANG
jgi:hypothetical protein